MLFLSYCNKQHSITQLACTMSYTIYHDLFHKLNNQIVLKQKVRQNNDIVRLTNCCWMFVWRCRIRKTRRVQEVSVAVMKVCHKVKCLQPQTERSLEFPWGKNRSCCPCLGLVQVDPPPPIRNIRTKDKYTEEGNSSNIYSKEKSLMTCGTCINMINTYQHMNTYQKGLRVAVAQEVERVRW